MQPRRQRTGESDSGLVVAPEFQTHGFQIVSQLLSSQKCDALTEILTGAFNVERKQSRARIGGLRNLLRTCPLVRETARNSQILNLVRDAAKREVFPVRAIFFDKTADANWAVPWHQDLSIAVVERVDVPGFSGWSIKEGVQHVQPPASVLESMLTLRIHLDDCSAENGALRVLPGSHRHGKLNNEEIDRWAQSGAFTCEVPKCGALLMRPLLLHSSFSSKQPAHRRVLHIEYAISQLPGGLNWFEEEGV